VLESVSQDNEVASHSYISCVQPLLGVCPIMSKSKAANHDTFVRATVSGSPVKKNLQGSLPHNPTKRKYEEMRRDLERELRGLWVGPMPVQAFLNEFLPLSDSSPMCKVPTDLIQSLPSMGDKMMPSQLVSNWSHFDVAVHNLTE